MAARSGLVRKQDVLRMIIDNGSGYRKVAAQHALADRPFGDLDIEDIPLKPGRKQLEQVFVLDGHTLLCGANKVRTWAARHPDQLHRIIQSYKRCLCPKYMNTAAATRVWTALDAKPGDLAAIQDLVAAHLRRIREAVIAFYRDRHPKSTRYPREYWDNNRIEAITTVSCNWDHEACVIVRNAALAGGFYNMDVAHEPICAAASDMDRMRGLGDIEYGEEVCFADIVKPTFDVATVRMTESVSDGARPQFDLVGNLIGDDAGA
ncbi:hypothetical protein B0A55_06917 [Friedmanniomyces simplex]|uniref:Uncharacterized protein n=1 Tax=Friedmanniomyces simplex TaxID=329884 RepID=A0A4U0X783_9PEZI|nr:hypothetical protein B0A55_06917 [Friedmanniomyces simplex]